MQWGQIKLLFILSFLVLDLFLLQQFLDKQQKAELGEISPTVVQNIEAKLANDGITIAPDVPKEAPSLSSMTASLSEFSDEMMSEIETLEKEGNQTIEFADQNSIVQATFDEPIKVDEENITQKVKEVIPFSGQYSYWGMDEEAGVALFFQKARNQTVYFNEGGLLMVTVEEGEMTGYYATLLKFPEDGPNTSSEEQQTVIPPYNVIGLLNDEGYLSEGDEITNMKVGYHTSINLSPGEEDGPQVFAPTWKVMVNEEKPLFVYAIQGNIVEINQQEFIREAAQFVGANIISEGKQTSDNGNSSKESE